MLGRIWACLRVSSFPMSREFRFLTTEFLASSKPQAEIIIVKRPIQGRNNVTRVWVEPRLCKLELSQKKIFDTFGHVFGGLSRRFVVSFDNKKLAFKLKPLKYLFLVMFNFGGSKRGVIIKIDFWKFSLWGFRRGGTQKFSETKPCF